MVMKMLIFDYRESEKQFFENHKYEDFDITFFSESLNDAFIQKLSKEQLEQTTVISVFINSEITKYVIDSFKNLRIITTRSTGIDHINHKAAIEKNIDVVNVESYGAKSVAQYTIGLIIAVVRKILPASKYILSKDEMCNNFVGRDISKLTLGVVGTGSIGASVCKLANAFGMKILAYDLSKKAELLNDTNMEYVSLNDLITNSDIITLHIPFTGENLNMFSKKEFEMMKDSAYIINTSRGEILDIFALYDALTTNKIKGACLDVISCEEASFKCDEYSKKLGKDMFCLSEAKLVKKMALMPNVIITPHIAYETQDAIDYLLEMSFRGILDCIKGGSKYKIL